MQIVFSRKSILAFLSVAVGMTFLRGRSESALVRAAQRRDSEAFDQLTASHLPSLRRFVARRIRAADLEDVLQETLLAAWQGLPAFDGNGNFRTWLYSICFHKIQDHWRREHCRPPSSSVVDAEGRAAYVPREFAGVELRESLRELWESSTPDQRELLRMYYSDGLTLKEISQILGRNLNTVKYQFYRFHEVAAEKFPEESELILVQESTS